MFLKQGKGSVIGFEPVQAECDKLNAMKRERHTFLPYFIGDGSDGTFHLNSAAMTSSLFETNHELVDLFNNLGELMQTKQRSSEKTTRLDDLPECRDADYLKIDVQGAELAVLRGGAEVLKHAVVVEAEAEFVPLYKGQPLFGDVDAFLRSQGFLLHSLRGVQGRTYKPLVLQNDVNRMLNQALWTDGVWVKDFTKLRSLTTEQILKLAVIVNDVYGSLDLAAFALQYHDERTGGGLWEGVMKQVLGGRVPPRGPMP
jgi:FkbM family methyltransferase